MEANPVFLGWIVFKNVGIIMNTVVFASWHGIV